MRLLLSSLILLSLGLLCPQWSGAGPLEDAMQRLANKMATGLSGDVGRPLVVAVVDFKAADPEHGSHLSDMLAGELSKLRSDFTVVARKKSRLLAIWRELNFGHSEQVDKKTAAEAGKQVGAKALVYARSELTSRLEKLTAGLVMVETGKIMLWEVEEAARTHPAAYGGMRSAVLPGWGQWSCGQKGTGTFFMSAAAGFGVSTFQANRKAKDAHDDAFLAGTPADRDRLLNEERDHRSRRNLMLAGLGATWVANILHASWVSTRTPIQAYVAPSGDLRVAVSRSF